MNARPSGAQRLELFSPIPKHVMGDDRLTAGHHRLLQAIAFRARFDDNGRGCYLSQAALAKEANIERTNVSHFAKDLVAWGIITSERAPFDRRQRIYRLIFKEKKAIVGEHTNENRIPDETTTENEILGVFTNNFTEVVGGEKHETVDSKRESNQQYIELNSDKISGETIIGENANFQPDNQVKRNRLTRWDDLRVKDREADRPIPLKIAAPK